MTRKPQKELHIRVALTIAAGASDIAIVSSIFFYWSSFSSELDKAKHGIDQLFTTIEKTASAAVYLDNEELAQEVVSGLSDNDLIHYTLLESKTGLSVENGDIKSNDNKNRAGAASLIRYEIKHPFAPDQIVGVLSVLPDQDFIEKSATSVAEKQVLLTIFQSILIAILVLFLVNRTLTKPLKKVAGMLHSVDPSQPHKLDCPQGHEEDEIGALVSDINVLLGSVENHIDLERQMRQESEALEKQFRLIYEEATAGIFLVDRAGHVVTANPAFHSILNSEVQLKGQSLDEFEICDFFEDRSIVENMLNDLQNSTGHMTIDGDLRLNLTGQHWVHCLFTKVVDDTGEDLIEGILYDVTQRIGREQDARFEADHDTLTGLCNRRSGERNINQVIHAPANSGSSSVVLLIDLDGFKPINDTHGHDAGDIVLVEVSKRLTNIVRGSDVVARWGGDEFLIALHKTVDLDAQSLDIICQKILDQLLLPIELQSGSSCTIGGSIGVARYPQDGQTLDQLIELADAAMYHAKNNGKNRFVLHGTF